jgi:hypothetical protein
MPQMLNTACPESESVHFIESVSEEVRDASCRESEGESTHNLT